MEVTDGASHGQHAVNATICEEASGFLYTMDLWHVRSLVVNTQIYYLSILGENSTTVARISTEYALVRDERHCGTTAYFRELLVVSFDLQVCG